jgi:glc operon protein GlcG
MISRPALTEADCSRLLEAATCEARRHGWSVAIAILDDGGHLLRFARLDGATPANAEFAILKARTAALSRRSSAVWEQRVRDGRIATLSMPVLAVQGGLPILVEGCCLGAVGVSGVLSEQDEQVAQAAINALPGG